MRYSILTILTFSCIVTLAFTLPKLPSRYGPYIPTTNQTLPAPFILQWSFLTNEFSFELWGSTNLVDWYQVDEVPISVNYTVNASKPCEFFRVRAKDLTTGEVSPWATK